MKTIIKIFSFKKRIKEKKVLLETEPKPIQITILPGKTELKEGCVIKKVVWSTS